MPTLRPLHNPNQALDDVTNKIGKLFIQFYLILILFDAFFVRLGFVLNALYLCAHPNLMISIVSVHCSRNKYIIFH